MTPRPGVRGAAATLISVLAACTACSPPAASPSSSAPGPGTETATPTLQARESRPIRVTGQRREVVRLAGDEGKALELVIAPGDMAAGTTVRGVAARGSLPARAPYASFTGPMTLELSAPATRPVVLRARTSSPDAVPVIWKLADGQWYPQAVGAPGDFAASREQAGGTFDAGGYLPAAWGASVQAAVTARARAVPAAPVCASATPAWATPGPAVPGLPACYGERRTDAGERVLQARIVNARALTVAVTVPEKAQETAVTGRSGGAVRRDAAYLGAARTVLVPPGAQLTFEVAAPAAAGQLTVQAAVTPRTLLADVAGLVFSSVADLGPSEPSAVGPALAQRCIASEPGVIDPLPAEAAGLTGRINLMALCVARAVAGPASSGEAGLAVSAARLDRTPAEVTADKGQAAAVRRDTGLVRLVAAIITHAKGLGPGAAALAAQALTGVGGTLSAALQPDRQLCLPAEKACVPLTAPLDLDGDGKPDRAVLAASGQPARGAQYTVRVRTASGAEHEQVFTASAGLGPARLAGAATIDGVIGQELVIALPFPTGGSYYVVLTLRPGGLRAMPLPSSGGRELALQTENSAGTVIGWTATSRGGRVLLIREEWRRSGTTWAGTATQWRWGADGWESADPAPALSPLSEAAARARHGFLAPGVSAR